MILPGLIKAPQFHSLIRNSTEDGKTRFRWLAFVVSHPSDKDKDVLPRPRGYPGAQMGHPQFHLPWVGKAGG
jgi:hypothetical protein